MNLLASTVWNVFLAAVPVVLAIPLARSIRRLGGQEGRNSRLFTAALAVVWLAFLPNSPYLLTEWRHFLFNPHFQAARDMTRPEEFSVYRVARHFAFYSVYSAIGLICFAVSVRWVVEAWRSLGRRGVSVAAPLFFLASLGVYLGLVVRLNSWDLFLRPRHVVKIASFALLRPHLLMIVCAFAAMLWASYLLLDIWMDGLWLRLAGTRFRSPVNPHQKLRIVPR